MEQWSAEHRAFVVEAYFKSGDSVVAVQRQFRRPLKRNSMGRPRSARTPENVERVREAVEASPRRPARKQAAALRMSYRSVRRILRYDLHFHPYKMAIVQQLKPTDYAKRNAFHFQSK
ncbi:hypothetical protein ACJJTC_017886 [Scirpophaga incertulas]